MRNTAAAIDVVRTRVFSASNGDRASNRNVAVVFLHATSADEGATVRAASDARRAGITLLVVGVTDHVNQRELEAIASYPTRSNVFRIPNYYSFVNIQRGLTRAACNGPHSFFYRATRQRNTICRLLPVLWWWRGVVVTSLVKINEVNLR